jgi:hypothetical protein
MWKQAFAVGALSTPLLVLGYRGQTDQLRKETHLVLLHLLQYPELCESLDTLGARPGLRGVSSRFDVDKQVMLTRTEIKGTRFAALAELTGNESLDDVRRLQLLDLQSGHRVGIDLKTHHAFSVSEQDWIEELTWEDAIVGSLNVLAPPVVFLSAFGLLLFLFQFRTKNSYSRRVFEMIRTQIVNSKTIHKTMGSHKVIVPRVYEGSIGQDRVDIRMSIESPATGRQGKIQIQGLKDPSDTWRFTKCSYQEVGSSHAVELRGTLRTEKLDCGPQAEAGSTSLRQ